MPRQLSESGSGVRLRDPVLVLESDCGIPFLISVSILKPNRGIWFQNLRNTEGEPVPVAVYGLDLLSQGDQQFLFINRVNQLLL